ncbi:MAG: DUF4330 family protein [Candidatus Omnitrophota bacterium]
MKIVDDRGRLFGKINIIDFAVFIFLLLLIPAVLVSCMASLMVPDKIDVEEREFTAIELPGYFVKIDPELMSEITVGDKEKNKTGEVVGEITWLGEPAAYVPSFNIGGEAQIKSIENTSKMIPAKLKLKVEIRGRDLLYNDQQVFLAIPLLFAANGYCVEFVPEPTREKPKEKWAQIEVKFDSINSELIRIIKEGDVENDLSGHTIAVVDRIVETSPSEFLAFMPSSGMLKAIDHPFLMEMVVLFSILCQEKGGDLYFNNSAVKIGNTFSFITKTYAFSGKIITLKER